MGAINATYNAFFFADLGEPFKGHLHPRYAHDCVEKCNLWPAAALTDLSNFGLEEIHEFIVSDRISELDRDFLGRRRLGDVVDSVDHGTVGGAEADDAIAFLKHQVPQDRVGPRRGVWHQNDGFQRCVEQLCCCCT